MSLRIKLQSATTLLLVLLIVFITACKKGGFLDQKTLSVIDEHAIFSDSTYTVDFVNGRYANVEYTYEPNRWGTGGVESACDEAQSAVTNTTANQLQNYLVNSAINPSVASADNLWTIVYQQVRAVNIFLRNESKLPVTKATKSYWEGQMRFLRAWYYALLLKQVGGFPIVGNTVYQDGDKINVPRSTYEKCVDYVVSECDSAAAMLPLNNLNSLPPYSPTVDYGRATKGAALGLKARVLLYAASPLTNQSRGDDPGHLVSYGNADPNRWKLAADAAQAVINLGQYSLYRSATPAYYQLFITNVGTQNPEVVFAFYPATTTPNNMFRETICNPPSRGTRYTGTISLFPLQELVDAFGMQNGKPISDPSSGYTGIGDNMYKNRDPRLYYTIEYNGASRAEAGYSGDQPIWTYTGVVPTTTNVNLLSVNTDGIYKSNATTTGYYCYKMCEDGVGPLAQENNRPRMLIRYAEVLLDAAEATNEFSGPSSQIYTWLKDIRSRAGIDAGADGMYGMNPNMTKDDMRAFLQNERQVELAFEEQRFWDVRRWKIAPQVLNKDMHGMEITRSASGTYSYRTIVVRKQIFTDNQYFFPISQSEITKSPALKQNPGY